MGIFLGKFEHNDSSQLSMQELYLLENQKARVDQVYVEGLKKTKDSIFESSVKLMFTSKSFRTILANAEIVRKNLMSLKCFEHVNVDIDVCDASNSTPYGYKVTFKTQERKLLSGVHHVETSDNEGFMKIGFQLNNLTGHADHFKLETSLGNNGTRNYNGCVFKYVPGNITSCISGNMFKKISHWNSVHGIFNEWGTLFDICFLASLKNHFSQNLQYEAVIRDINMLSKESPFRLREESGLSIKSSIKHLTTLDTRDSKVLPNEGVFCQMVMEVAGFGGDVSFFRNHFITQFFSKISRDVVFQGSFGGGLLTDFGTYKKPNIMDKFFLGGPMTLRGFQSRGIGDLNDDAVAGAMSYWIMAAHIYVKPMFGMESNRINEALRLHLFCNAGNISFLGNNVNSMLKNFRLSSGVGLVARLGNSIRFEFNLCTPLQYMTGDRIVEGFQFGVGVNFV